jgi:deoxyribodipyrimidine photo-lyase
MSLSPDARALVWLKRDLRLHDHPPLASAASAGEALSIFVTEPAWTQSPEFSPRQAHFAWASVAELQAGLAGRGLRLLHLQGDMPGLLQALWQRWPFSHLLSHEETGAGWSYARDIAVAAWCRAQGVQWLQWPQTGVVRRLKSRSGWAARWAQRMNAPQVCTPERFCAAGLDAGQLPQAALAPWPVAEALPLVPAGEAAAQQVLHSFLHARGADYRRALSSPLTAEQGCSRLSPHLAFGTVSMRQVHQATQARIAQAAASADAQERRYAYGLRGFAGRLRWHCHFMQKLEDEPAIEQRNFARAVDGLRPGDHAATPDGQAPPPWDASAEVRLQAWAEGATGYPMVDACMRSLNASGWLNFRMRAMLVSFAAYHLWLHWRPTGWHLARQFVDFEAGIHWSQMQMQSGTTGINTLRVYSPSKQAREQDSQGEFIRRWVPELRDLPSAFIHNPWLAPAPPKAYPPPIVDERAAAAAAKERLYALRKTHGARQEAQAIQHKHGSRKSGLPPTGRVKGGHAAARTAVAGHPAQAELFGTEDA